MATGLGLVIGVQLSDRSENPKASIYPDIAKDGGFAPNAWIRIQQDDTVTVWVNHSEMGQGITTALPMIVAEELEAEWSKVGFEIAPVADEYKHPTYGIQWTVSSKSVESSWDLLRQAGATARELFISAAADIWEVPKEDCRAENARVLHTTSGNILRYGELISKAAKMPIPKKVRLKEPREYQLKIYGLSSSMMIQGYQSAGGVRWRPLRTVLPSSASSMKLLRPLIGIHTI